MKVQCSLKYLYKTSKILHEIFYMQRKVMLFNNSVCDQSPFSAKYKFRNKRNKPINAGVLEHPDKRFVLPRGEEAVLCVAVVVDVCMRVLQPLCYDSTLALDKYAHVTEYRLLDLPLCTTLGSLNRFDYSFIHNSHNVLRCQCRCLGLSTGVPQRDQVNVIEILLASTFIAQLAAE